MKKLLLALMLLMSSFAYCGGNIYVDVQAGFNSLSFAGGGHDFTSQFGLGYNPDSAFLIGVDFGYNPSSSVLSSLHTVDDELIKSSGNFSFGPTLKWSPLGTFYNQRSWKWFDILLFAGAGMDYYRCTNESRFYGGYLKGGLEFDFNVKNLTFLINADATEKMAAAYKNNEQGLSPNYMQQNLYIGLRYNISVGSRSRHTTVIENYNTINIPQDSVVVYNNINACGETAAPVIVKSDPIILHDTIIRIVHDTIEKDIEVSNLTSQNVLFANDKYDIRTTEVYKLNLVLETVQAHPELKLELVGMANKTGNAAHNKWLSEKRCESVKNWFILHGVDSSRISEVPMGDGASDGEGVDRCVVIKFSK